MQTISPGVMLAGNYQLATILFYKDKTALGHLSLNCHWNLQFAYQFTLHKRLLTARQL